MAETTAGAAAVPRTERLTTADGKPLAAALVRAQARARRRAFLLVAPLLLFVLVTFVLPIGQMLFRSVHHDGFSANMPNLVQWFDANPQGTDPDEAAFAALARSEAIYKDERFSDHAPITVGYEFAL